MRPRHQGPDKPGYNARWKPKNYYNIILDINRPEQGLVRLVK
jgi:hypothetical protein